jgi:hypothetical protein
MISAAINVINFSNCITTYKFDSVKFFSCTDNMDRINNAFKLGVSLYVINAIFMVRLFYDYKCKDKPEDQYQEIDDNKS